MKSYNKDKKRNKINYNLQHDDKQHWATAFGVNVTNSSPLTECQTEKF